MLFVFPVELVLLITLMAGNNTFNQSSIIGRLSWVKPLFFIKCWIVFLCFTTKTFSQEINVSGVVRDSVSLEPLEGATVIIDYRKNLSGTKTDKNGKFSISISRGSHVVAVRFVGYLAVKEILPDKNQDFNLVFNLSRLSTQLEQVVVDRKSVV